MFDPTFASILIAVIGGGFGVWSAYVSSKNQKATKNITSVLENTKGPVDSLDQVIKVLQDELVQVNKRHDQERKFFDIEISRLRTENKQDREESSRERFIMQAELDKLIGERVTLLEQIGVLKDQLGQLEEKVKSSLDDMKTS